ncbi:MAG: hypothetical protein AB7R89_33330 [Dehalococcoidia bacterium]
MHQTAHRTITAGITTIPAREPHEDPHAYGLRIFRFMVESDTCAAAMADEATEYAYAASIYPITAPDITDATRARFTNIRRDLAQTIHRRHAQRRQALAHIAAQLAQEPPAPTTGGGGSRVPTHPAPSSPTAPVAIPAWPTVADPL